MPVEDYEDLDAIEARVRRHLESIVADLIDVFEADVPTFIAREVRNRFVAHPAFAESIPDEKLVEIKKRCDIVGDEAANAMREALTGDMEFWFGPDVPHGDGKTFDVHETLIDRLQLAAQETERILREYQFPADEGDNYQIKYTPPAYFVKGKYTPGLAENFWKYLAQLNEVREARRQQDEGRRKALQRHRWDTVEQKKPKPKPDES